MDVEVWGTDSPAYCRKLRQSLYTALVLSSKVLWSRFWSESPWFGCFSRVASCGCGQHSGKRAPSVIATSKSRILFYGLVFSLAPTRSFGCAVLGDRQYKVVLLCCNSAMNANTYTPTPAIDCQHLCHQHNTYTLLDSQPPLCLQVNA